MSLLWTRSSKRTISPAVNPAGLQIGLSFEKLAQLIERYTEVWPNEKVSHFFIDERGIQVVLESKSKEAF